MVLIIQQTPRLCSHHCHGTRMDDGSTVATGKIAIFVFKQTELTSLNSPASSR